MISRDNQRRLFKGTIFLLMVALGYAVVQHIVNEQKRAVAAKRASVVAGDALSVSNTAYMMLDDRGKIIKSSPDADLMFANGNDVEGRNVHDWCADRDAAKRASGAMAKWYATATTGSRRVLIVSANLPTGKEDLFITATALRREPGSEIKMMAFVNYMNQVSFSDLRAPIIKPPVAK